MEKVVLISAKVVSVQVTARHISEGVPNHLNNPIALALRPYFKSVSVTMEGVMADSRHYALPQDASAFLYFYLNGYEVSPISFTLSK
jgi:hypothetical protein